MIILAILTDQADLDDLSFFLWVLIVLYSIVISLTYLLLIFKIYKSDKLLQTAPVIHFLFTEDSFTIEANNDIYQNKTSGTYDLIHHVTNTKKYLFIFYNANNAYVVEKSKFITGDANALIQLFKEKNIKVK